ncbi:hypothetical protein N7481_006177 [Penicillium waksmanii]|uniref:uncharacterized protein n=1 Tax=Penicillium waksmanii TaxID=69791 RepID=UPI002547E4A9|nr:uncharacterized protein N7481_006177 [Penicillium waksmanii]KAJ5984078.1 hypothetical protein N7481_006177 [Penicillium waksmanii]
MTAGAAKLTRLQAGRLSPILRVETALTQGVHEQIEPNGRGCDVIYHKSTAGPLFSPDTPPDLSLR